MGQKDIDAEMDKGNSAKKLQERLTNRRNYQDNGNSPHQYYPFNPFKF